MAMKAYALPLLVGAVIQIPDVALADIAVLDRSILQEDTARGGTTRKIETTDKQRHTINTSVTCAMYRPSRRNDPVGAAQQNAEIAGLVRRIAREEAVDENEFLALIYQESRFNPCAKSPVGATGLAQLMPGTAAELGVNEHNIEENLRGGARYYRQQLQLYKGNVALALAAYNSGAGNVNKYGGIPPFKETQGYVRRITQDWLPAFGGSDKSTMPLNFGGGGTAYTSMRDSTLNAMGTTAATSASLPGVASWYQELAGLPTGTIQDSWDHNSTVRNANLEMMNAAIRLGTAMAGLINARNSVTVSNLSSSSQSASNGKESPSHPTGPCDPAQNLVWDPRQQVCVQIREDASNVQLMLQPL
jgi:hypothetical protein